MNTNQSFPTEFATIKNGTTVEYWKKFSRGHERMMIRNWATNRQAIEHARRLNRHNKKGVY